VGGGRVGCCRSTKPLFAFMDTARIIREADIIPNRAAGYTYSCADPADRSIGKTISSPGSCCHYAWWAEEKSFDAKAGPGVSPLRANFPESQLQFVFPEFSQMPNSVPNKQPSAAPGSQQKAVAPNIISMESLPASIMPSMGTEVIVPPISVPSIAPRTIQSRGEILSAWAIAHLPSCHRRVCAALASRTSAGLPLGRPPPVISSSPSNAVGLFRQSLQVAFKLGGSSAHGMQAP
jgi:hypothetical protein